MDGKERSKCTVACIPYTIINIKYAFLNYHLPFGRFGVWLRNNHHRCLMVPHCVLLLKLLYAWAYTYIWSHIFHSHDLQILHIKSGGSGSGWATSTCLVSQHAGSIILFGPSRRLPSSFLVWGLVVGLILLRLNPNGTVQRMLMFLVLSLQKVQWSCRSCGTYKSALGFVTVSFFYPIQIISYSFHQFL